MQLLKDNSLEKEIRNMRKFLNKDETCLFAMGKDAFHKLGDISRNEWDLIQLFEEDEGNYYGNFMYGYGFMDVRFPKDSVRPLNKKEIKEYEGSGISISNNYLGKLEIKDSLLEKK